MYATEEYRFANAYLQPDEHILWRGKPGKGNLLTQRDILFIPFSIFWCGFAIFWLVTAISSGAPVFFWVFGIPFVAIGLFMVFGRFIYTAYMRKCTAYVITSQKILRRRGKHIDMLLEGSIPAAHVEIHKNGNGTIHFRPEGYGSYYYPRNRAMENGFSLENLTDVLRAQQALGDMKKY